MAKFKLNNKIEKYLEEQISTKSDLKVQELEEIVWKIIKKKIDKEKFWFNYRLRFALASLLIIIMIFSANIYVERSHNNYNKPQNTQTTLEVVPTKTGLENTAEIDTKISSLIEEIESESSSSNIDSDFPELNVEI